ncbi:MAG: hypothetical protein JOZ16_05775 [Methylobacteriaceae bacterium]|nr:hypothetical protein [Methylobacteriaceae bacterium]
MKSTAIISAAAFLILAGSAFAQNEGNPVSGLGDARAQDQPSSVGINNGYDTRSVTPVPLSPDLEGRSTTTRNQRRYRE